MSLYKDLKTVAMKYADNNALFYRNRFYTYGEIVKQIDSISDYLKNEIHLHASNVVSICLANSFFSLCLIYACNKIGVIVNLINPSLTNDEIIYFDSIIKTRILFLEAKNYQANCDSYKNLQSKIALIDNEKIDFSFDGFLRTIWRKFKFFTFERGGIPFNFKNNKKYIEHCEPNFSQSNIALTGANEKFKEKPHIVCLTNDNIHCASKSQKEAFNPYFQDVMLIDATMMSISMFISYFHTPLTHNVVICVDDTTNKNAYQKLLKNERFDIYASDYDGVERLLKLQNEYPLQHLKTIFIYNDFQRSYLFNTFLNLTNFKNSNTSYISLIGLSETSGFFAYGKFNKETYNDFGKLLDGYQYKIGLSNSFWNKRKDFNLYLKSNSIMSGYYKETEMNDSIIFNGYLDSKFQGEINKDNHFILANKDLLDVYKSSAPYYCCLQDMIMTIPGIQDVFIQTSLNSKDTMELIVDVDLSEQQRIKKEVSKYLDTQLRNKAITYDIIFKKKIN